MVQAGLIITLAASGSSGERRKTIIDQDAVGPGPPNLQPMLLLLQSPDVADDRGAAYG